MRAFCFAVAAILMVFNSVSTARAALLPTDSYFVESGGVVVGEAENFHARTGFSATETWKVVPGEEVPGDNANAISGARGGLYVQSLADNGVGGGGPNVTPTIEYRVNITTTGTYQLYLRWEANGTNASTIGASDSMFADIVELKDGIVANPIADYYEFQQTLDGDFDTNPWDGLGGKEQNVAGPANNPVTWSITTPGIYTIRLSQREDGAAVDAWVFQLSNLTAPTGLGPAESLVVIPEPASALIFVPVGLAYACYRRQRRQLQ